MAIVICSHCGFTTDETNVVWYESRNYQAWCLTCIESEIEDGFNNG
jgi:hypothetical protein